MAEDIMFETFNRSPVVKGDLFIDPLGADAIRDPSHVPLLESSVDFSPFSKTSSKHGRSMNDPEGKIFTKQTIVDENGDSYTSLSIKGADCSRPDVEYYPIEPSYARVTGMLDASTFVRCMKISQLLRSTGVLTEWPIYHARPRLFPDGEEDVTLNEFRQGIYGNFLDEQLSLRELGEPSLPVGIVGLTGQGVSELQFSVMYRASLSPVRLWELQEHERSGDLIEHIADSIRALQQRKPQHFGCWDAIEALNPDDYEDHVTYLEVVLPRIMGENLARFHNTGCYHKYLNGGNWTLAAEIVDLDSVRNGDIYPEDAPEVTAVNRLDEAFGQAHLVHKISLCAEELACSLTDIIPGMDAIAAKRNRFLTMWDDFMTSYFSERYPETIGNTLERAVLLSHFARLPENPDDWEEPDIVSILDVDAEIIDAIKAAATTMTEVKVKQIQRMLKPIVRQKVQEILVNSGIKVAPWWLEIDLIEDEEASKLFMAILNQFI